MLIAAIIVGVVLLIVAGLHLRLSLTPEYAWKKRVIAIVREAEEKRRLAERQISQLRAEREQAQRDFAAHVKTRIFQSMSVDLLKDYPGIGDATVQRLRDAGLRQISEVMRFNLFRIDGFGPARVRDISSALANLESFANKRIADPGDPVVLAERSQQEKDDQRRWERMNECEAIAKHSGGVLQDFHARRALADRINIVTYLVSGWFPNLSPEQLSETLTYPTFRYETPKAAPEPKPAPKQQSEVTIHESIPEPTKPIELPNPAEVPKATESPVPKPPIVEAPPQAPPTPVEILKAVAGLGLAVAKADGRIAASERKQLSVFLERRFAPTAELKAMIAGLVAAESADILPLADAIWEAKRCVSARQFGDLYQLACSIADAAGERNAREIATLAEVRSSLSLDDKNNANLPPVIVESPSTELTEAIGRERLEIAPGVTLSVDLIRRQYRLLDERYSHAKFAGTDPEFAKLAEEKRKAVLAAAEFLIKAFGEPLTPPDQPKQPVDDRHNPDLDAVFGV